MGMNMAIWDLDNCLSNDEWRLRRINWATENMDERYAAYHAVCGDDPPSNLDVYYAVRLLAVPIFFTARPEEVRAQTEAWIRRHLDEPKPMVLMRRRSGLDLKLSSVEIKRAMLRGLMASIVDADRLNEFDALLGFDDRQDIVAMYKEMGIKARLLKVHDFCTLTPPRRTA